MGWRFVLKGIAMVALLICCTVAMFYGVVYLLLGSIGRKVWGLALLIGGFRGFILAFDLMWGRPPAFSRRPWDRPWEKDAPGPPRA